MSYWNMPRRLLKDLFLLLIGLVVLEVYRPTTNPHEHHVLLACNAVCWLLASALDVKGWSAASVLINVCHVFCMKACGSPMLRQFMFRLLGL